MNRFESITESGQLDSKDGETVRDRDARARLVKARAAMVVNHPFFASLSLRLDLREDTSCHTAWTDGKVMGYNPNYIKVLSQEKLVGLTAHTVMHPACRHHERRQDRDPKLWNKACDYAINPILIDAGLTLPDGFLMDPAYEGKTADEVYARLKEGEAEEEKGEGQREDPDPEKDNRENPEEENGAQEAGPSEKDTSPDETDPGMAGEVRDGNSDPRSAPGETEEETDWEQAMVQAAGNARAMGALPRGIDLFVKDRLSPRLPWQELLALFIQQSARADYTWTQPNRRYVHQDLYFPALVSDRLPELAVAVDTSGSIRPGELDGFAAELSAILSMNPSRIHLLYTDMAVNRYQAVDPWDLPVTFSPKGGGGTDFRPAFRFLDRQGIQPYCLIYLTDLECRLFPGRPPGYPVLWVQVGQGGYDPPFGRKIRFS